MEAFSPNHEFGGYGISHCPVENVGKWRDVGRSRSLAKAQFALNLKYAKNILHVISLEGRRELLKI